MPPEITLRHLPGRKQRPFWPYLDPDIGSSDENSSVPTTSTEKKMRQPKPKDEKNALKEMDSSYEGFEDLFEIPEVVPQKTLGEKAAASGSQKRASSETQASSPYSAQYPVSRQVFDLEKKAQELQEKRDYFQNQCNELTLTLERLNKATKKERSVYQAKCTSLKAANDDLAKQLEEEKDKVEQLQCENESLVKDLAAATERKDFFAKMLEEKAYESWIFRCALAVVFKSTPSTRERVSMRKVICDCFAALKQKYQQDRGLQQGDQQEEGPSLSGAEDLYSDSEETPLRKIAAKKKRSRATGERESRVSSDDSEEKPLKKQAPPKKRARVPEKKDNRVSKDDSDDDDQPLFSVLKKRAKKLKIMPSREKSSSFD
ncbi:uncharacterized protein Triagg1_9527 [Trichoderma aggressivum f. europaeum]|uniref:Uncharacterized protein n=1 Tax=Trichoderma aggressivum f. europaeum TaxID=173218 RepID=A0AAE1LZ01_9HYPO|nr:hypothetical protein Triagg1_9527 [Trichoderma aggressivum f. europaeum]